VYCLQVINETEIFIQSIDADVNEEASDFSDLIDLFKLYKDKLKNFKSSREYKEMELELLGKTNREKVTRIKNIVNLAFSEEKLNDLDLVHAADRKELLNRLIDRASLLEEYSCIIEILRSSWIDPFSSRLVIVFRKQVL
jgi:hypothetical protein